ncbi:hypothetical protein BDV95DRAFT_597760 [Massariosphaeria phaeospora]|uniref:Uncharacterized protein n=1 Tax=Massariosphaeria phaeospora TaxID=100035 RepID=A0A7C8I156_9PLEO|nr:hypothetical protein BDV95DRAFT_597760 [Massariosphaeria phaeospora]
MPLISSPKAAYNESPFMLDMAASSAARSSLREQLQPLRRLAGLNWALDVLATCITVTEDIEEMLAVEFFRSLAPALLRRPPHARRGAEEERPTLAARGFDGPAIPAHSVAAAHTADITTNSLKANRRRRLRGARVYGSEDHAHGLPYALRLPSRRMRLSARWQGRESPNSSSAHRGRKRAPREEEVRIENGAPFSTSEEQQFRTPEAVTLSLEADHLRRMDAPRRRDTNSGVATTGIIGYYFDLGVLKKTGTLRDGPSIFGRDCSRRRIFERQHEYETTMFRSTMTQRDVLLDTLRLTTSTTVAHTASRIRRKQKELGTVHGQAGRQAQRNGRSGFLELLSRAGQEDVYLCTRPNGNGNRRTNCRYRILDMPDTRREYRNKERAGHMARGIENHWCTGYLELAQPLRISTQLGAPKLIPKGVCGDNGAISGEEHCN